MIGRLLGLISGQEVTTSVPAPTIRDDGDPWAMLKRPPEEWNIDVMFAAKRGAPVSSTPHVMLMVPTYREPYEVVARCSPSQAAVALDLQQHGLVAEYGNIDGDSLVCRMRHRAMNTFLKSAATHLLWWDADIECLTPDCVRKMLESGHDVVAGACPFKNGSGRTVHNLWPGTVERWESDGRVEMYKGCVEVMDAGTGFMLVSRKAIYKLIAAHPDTLHWSRGVQDGGEPLFALFDTAIVDGVYQSEDYLFCRRWQKLGGKVYVYVPARFRHYGIHGFEASFEEQYGLSRT